MLGSRVVPRPGLVRALCTPEAAGIVLILAALLGVALLGGCSSGAEIRLAFMGAEVGLKFRGPDVKPPTAKVEAGVDASTPPAPATDATPKPAPEVPAK